MQANLTRTGKYAIMRYMLPDHHTHENQKAQLHEKINFHKNNMILQCLVSAMLVTGGFYASQRKSVLVPLIVAPSVGVALSKLSKHRNEYNRCKQQFQILNEKG